MNETYTRNGLTIALRSTKPGAKYTTRIRFQGQVHNLTLCETVEESFKAAVLARREIHAGRWQAFRTATGLRSPEKFATLAEVETAYMAFPGGDKGIKLVTKERNWQAMERLLRAAAPTATSTSELTGKLIADWKWQKRELSAKQTDSESQTRVLRSAQSELLQARSVFSPEALSYYRERSKLNLPESIKAFCSEPGFNHVSKDEYHAPTDTIIADTFAVIDKLVQDAQGGRLPAAEVPTKNRNVYVAFWLAIGFGLRASEMTKAQAKDFETVAGDVFFRPEWRPKNKRACEIGVQLDAWSRLAPFLDGLDKEAFALGGTMTERTTDVFRRVSALFQSIGWETTHHIHEMRAWAGCQIAMNHPQGLLAAQAFLRHGSYDTTQQYYGHHIKVRLTKVALKIPAAAQPPTVHTTVSTATNGGVSTYIPATNAETSSDS